MATASVTNGQILNYSYTGAVQSVTLPKGTFKLEVWGAQGGYRSSSTYGGLGGYSAGTIELTAATTLYIYVGGEGGGSTTNTGAVVTGGFNGGGYRYGYPGGGGASDIRIASTSLYARVIVAGGGGSCGATSKQGMYGGGESGGASTENYGSYGYGGTQTGFTTTVTALTTQPTTNSTSNYPGGFGFGGFGIYTSSGYGGAGGGGWYGGCGACPDSSADDDRGGGGGSGYVYNSTNAANYPSGCLLNSSYYLSDTSLIAGNASFTDPGGSTVTGHSGNGYARITVVKATPADATNLKYSVAERKVTLTWTASTDSVTGYNIYYGTSTSKTGTTTSTTFTTGVTYSPGINHTFTVKAYNDSGESDGVSVIVYFSAPPAPTNVKVTLTDGMYHVTWTKPSTSIAIDYYMVYYGSDSVYTQIGTTTSTSYDVSFAQASTYAPDPVVDDPDQPTNGTNYYYKGFHIYSHATESWSTTYGYDYVAIPVLPNTPTDLKLDSLSNSLAELSWSYTGDWTEDDVSLVDGFHVYVDGNLVAASADTNYECFLSPDVAHTILVYAYNAIGESESAASLSLTYSLPAAPASISASIQDGELLLSWPESTTADVTKYNVYMDNTILIGTTPWIPKFSFAFSNESTDEPLLIMGEKGSLTSFLQEITTGKVYTFGVSAVNAYGESETVSITLQATSNLSISSVTLNPNPVNTKASLTITANVLENLVLNVLS